MQDFLPINKEDMDKRGWEQLDFVFVSGDAYVDHPSFGPAILCRLLEKHGYHVRGIQVMDASRRTTKSNAYFTGFGKMKSGFARTKRGSGKTRNRSGLMRRESGNRKKDSAARNSS